MAKLILENPEKEVEVEDNSSIKGVCENDFNVPFGCEDGICGTCIVEVKEGMENLSERNEKEDELGLRDNERLACQCKIKQGSVKIKY
ncbi:ferredoxin [Candidatus Pacearchaeota archaeon]|nr:ferredoxin [Candidatus Pacearchaeota archaeon]|tara:strand:- start:739 stop:1002 length:264 start_codon:yes stop_codon:yes gene_type:complete